MAEAAEARNVAVGPSSIADAAVQTFRHGTPVLKIIVSVAFSLLAVGTILYSLGLNDGFDGWAIQLAVPFITSGVLLLAGVNAYWRAVRAEQRRGQVSALEEQVRENPKESKLAWDLARVKLESYLDRNLRQVSAIFVLILIVMIFGMGLVGFGVWRAIKVPDAIAPPALAAISGVIVQFIGGTFLIIYRSTMEQAKNYVIVLERINAVGMSINILEAIENESSNVRDTTRAALARDLLGMYGTPAAAHSTPDVPLAPT